MSEDGSANVQSDTVADGLIRVGWREQVALPQLGIACLRAKIDTGARTSSLRVDAQWRSVEAGAPWVQFRLATGLVTGLATGLGTDLATGLANDRHGVGMMVEAAAPLHDERMVTDSGGRRTRRVFIRTVLSLAGVEHEIEINLTDRCGMLFPMLVGRSALQGVFCVDPAGSFLHPHCRP